MQVELKLIAHNNLNSQGTYVNLFDFKVLSNFRSSIHDQITCLRSLQLRNLFSFYSENHKSMTSVRQ